MQNKALFAVKQAIMHAFCAENAEYAQKYPFLQKSLSNCRNRSKMQNKQIIALFGSPKLAYFPLKNGKNNRDPGKIGNSAVWPVLAASAKLGGPFRARFWGAYMKLRWAFSGFG